MYEERDNCWQAYCVWILEGCARCNSPAGKLTERNQRVEDPPSTKRLGLATPDGG